MKFISVKSCILAATLVATAVLFSACGDSDKSPSGPSPVTFQPDIPSGTTGASGGEAPAPAPAPSGGGSEDGGLNAPSCDFTVVRKDIKLWQDGDSTRVKGIVPGTPASSGRTLVYIWFPKVNGGDQKGPFDLNKEFSIEMGNYGSYNYQVAVERDINGDDRADDGCQDDRHFGSVTLKEPEEPKECPANDESSIDAVLTQGEGRACYSVTWNTNQPGPYQVLEDGNVRITGEKSGERVFCYEGADEEHTFSFSAGLCDPEVTIKTPPLRCEEEKRPTFDTRGPEREYWTPEGPNYCYYDLGDINDGEFPYGLPDGNSQSDDDRQRLCESEGGTWLNNYNPPGVNGGTLSNVCRVEGSIDYNGPGNDDKIDDNDRYGCHQQEASGVKVGAAVQFVNHGNWKAILRASTGHNKGQVEWEGVCGETQRFNNLLDVGGTNAIDGDLYYGSSSAHTDSTFTLEVYLNGNKVN